MYDTFDDFLDYRDYADDDYEPEMPEYMGQIEKIIDAEVERRLAEKVADIEELRKQQEEYRDTLMERSQTIGELQRELKAAKRAAERAEADKQAELQRKRTETVKELLNGWDEVTRAYKLEENDYRVKCPVCNGNKTISRVFDGTEYSAKCPVCSDHYYSCDRFKFYKVKDITWYNTGSLVIYAEQSGNVYPAVYNDFYVNSAVNLNTCYRTKEEAQAEADRRNGENRAKAEERVRKFIEEKGYGNLVKEDQSEDAT